MWISNCKSPVSTSLLTSDCKPIAVKSRRYSLKHKEFIVMEVKRLLKENIIEPSKLPWRAQVLIMTHENHKKRIVVDYSQTINRYTQLDAYPLFHIDDMVSDITKYHIFNTLDCLPSDTHQAGGKTLHSIRSLWAFISIP